MLLWNYKIHTHEIWKENEDVQSTEKASQGNPKGDAVPPKVRYPQNDAFFTATSSGFANSFFGLTPAVTIL